MSVGPVDAPRAVPLQVQRAAQLLWVLVALIFIRTLLTAIVYDGYGGALALPFVVAVGLGAVLGLAAYSVPRGQGWARWVALFFCLLTVVGGLGGALSPTSFGQAALGLVGALCAAAATVFLFTGPANPFFAGRRGSAR